MKAKNIGQFNSINKFVEAKLNVINSKEPTFEALFEQMFLEREAVLLEKSAGYKIIKITYGQAHDHILLRATYLRGVLSDLEQGTVVGLAMDNCIEWIENFWAILAAGFCPLLINLRIDNNSVDKAIGMTSAGAIISDNREFQVRTISEKDIAEGIAGRDGIKLESNDFQGNVFGTEILVMSSGTSENVKVCAYSAYEIRTQINDSYNIIKKCRLLKKHYNGELKLLTFLPFYHIFGLVAVYIWFTFFSRTLVQLNDFAPNTILNTIRRHNVTHIFAVPMFWEKVYSQAIKTIKDRGDATYNKFMKGLALSEKLDNIPALGDLFKKKAFEEVRTNLFGESICFMITGGSAISSDAIRFFNGIGYHLADGYGMTEIGITSVELGRKSKYLNACSVGIPFSSIQYKISDEGELLVSGESVAKYILEGNTKTQKGEWFHTRDMASESGGRYYILGRMDDVVISESGENLNPNIIEPYFNNPTINGVCLIGEKNGDYSTPVLVVSIDKYLSKDKFIAVDSFVRNKLTETKLDSMIGKVVYISDALIEDNDFKVKRGAIQKKYAEGKFDVLIPGQVNHVETPENEAAHKIRTIIAIATGRDPEDVGYDADFFLDCGGSSLEYFAACSEIEKEFSVAIPVVDGENLKSVKAFCEFIEANK